MTHHVLYIFRVGNTSGRSLKVESCIKPPIDSMNYTGCWAIMAFKINMLASSASRCGSCPLFMPETRWLVLVLRGCCGLLLDPQCHFPVLLSLSSAQVWMEAPLCLAVSRVSLEDILWTAFPSRTCHGFCLRAFLILAFNHGGHFQDYCSSTT